MLSTLRQPLEILAARHEKLYLLSVSAEREVFEQEMITKAHSFSPVVTVTYQL